MDSACSQVPLVRLPKKDPPLTSPDRVVEPLSFEEQDPGTLPTDDNDPDEKGVQINWR